MQLRSNESLLLTRNTKDFITIAQKEIKSFAEQINKPNEAGLSLLQLAAREGLSDAVLILCLQGADTAYQGQGKTALQLAAEQQHELTVKILKIFTPENREQDETILKAIYVYAVKQYQAPEGLKLPDASEAICQGLLALAAFLNKSEWIEYFLTCYPNYIYQNGIARTPGYWMACHVDTITKEIKKFAEAKNSDQEQQNKIAKLNIKLAKTKELFDKLNTNKETKIVTAGQLQSDNRDELVETFYPSIDIPDWFLEDKETIEQKYKNAYSEASRNKTKFVNNFSWENRRAVLKYAIQRNNFAAIIVMHDCFDRNQHFFISTLSNMPGVMEFELISQNLSFYQFIWQSDFTYRKNFLQTFFNKVGILNVLIGWHLLNKKLSQNELEIYNVLLKNDNEVLTLARTRLTHFYPDTHSLAAQQAFNTLLENFGIAYLVQPEVKQTTFAKLPDRILQNILNFVTDIKSAKELQEETQKNALILTSKKFYTIVLGARFKLEKALPDLELDHNKILSDKKLVNEQIKLLRQLEDDINASIRVRVKCRSRVLIFGAIMVPWSLLIGNSVCLYKLFSNRHSIIEDLSAIPVVNGTNCNNDFNIKDHAGCTRIIGWDRGMPVTAPVPEACAPLCKLLDYADKNFAGSCATISFIIVFAICLPWTLCCFADPDYEKRGTPLNDLPNDLSKQLPAINAFLINKLDEKTKAEIVSKRIIDVIIPEKQAEIKALETKEKYLLNKKGIFTLFKPKEYKKEVVIHIPDYSENKSEEDMMQEVKSVPNIGSLNNDLAEHLLVKEQAPRRSICPSCVIL